LEKASADLLGLRIIGKTPDTLQLGAWRWAVLKQIIEWHSFAYFTAGL
jgi:hypothetical protein